MAQAWSNTLEMVLWQSEILIMLVVMPAMLIINLIVNHQRSSQFNIISIVIAIIISLCLQAPESDR